MEKILVSACLVGRKVRYDGEASDAADDRLESWRREGRLVAVCPEIAGGLSVPRPPAEIRGGDGEDVLEGTARLITDGGEDVTELFVAGARHALEVARRYGLRVAILKSRSPSCGSTTIYDGSFSGTKIEGMGVTAALLRREGLEVFNEKQLDEAARALERLERGKIG